MNTVKFFKRVALPLVMLTVLAVSSVFFGCSGGENDNWNVSASGSDVKAYFLDDGNYGFILVVSGSGNMKDFSSAKDSPWYGKSGRISEIRILNGITRIGSNAFSGAKVDYAIIPETVKSVGQNAFGDDTELFVYEGVSVYEGARVYKYSETAPSSGNFWHYANATPEKWIIPNKNVKKVLFIGNSFTFYSDMPGLFKSVASGAGLDVTVESVTNGSHTLTKFADKNDEYGKIVDEKLNASNDYDAVVLQDQSTRPLNNNAGFVSAVKAMAEKINSTQTSCKIYLYSTWGYEEAATSLKISVPETELRIRKAYVAAAGQINAEVCFVGKAFTKVYTENPEINLYFSDNKHPSYGGAFLSACVHAATILNVDPRASSFNGDANEISSENAKTLKQAAYSTVFGRK